MKRRELASPAAEVNPVAAGSRPAEASSPRRAPAFAARAYSATAVPMIGPIGQPASLRPRAGA